MNSLLVRLKPYENDETIISYCYRLADVNARLFGDFAHTPGSNRLDIFKLRKYYNRFIDMWGMEEAEIYPLTLERFTQDYVEHGHLRRRSYHVISYRTKICPYCLQEADYLRIQWILTPSTICLKHSKYLITKCSNCGKLLKMLQQYSQMCDCGLNLRDMTSKTCSHEEMQLQKFLESKISGLGIEQDMLPENNPLSELTLIKYIDLMTKAIEFIIGIENVQKSYLNEETIDPYGPIVTRDNVEYILHYWLKAINVFKNGFSNYLMYLKNLYMSLPPVYQEEMKMAVRGLSFIRGTYDIVIENVSPNKINAFEDSIYY